MFLAASLRPGDIEVAPARRAGADEDRVVVLREQLLQAVDVAATAELDADIEDIADFLVDHRFGQPKFGICVRIMPPACGSPSKTVT